MKNRLKSSLASLLSLLLLAGSARAQLTIPGADGSDGALNISCGQNNRIHSQSKWHTIGGDRKTSSF